MEDRRKFIKNMALSILPLPSVKNLSMQSGIFFDTVNLWKLPAIGIQLYSVKEDMESDTPNTLKKLGAMGYTQIESFGSDESMYWGMEPKAFKKLAADNNLAFVSCHYDNKSEGFKKQVEIAASIGLKYLICPWKGPQTTIDAFKHFVDEFNTKGLFAKSLEYVLVTVHTDMAIKKFTGITHRCVTQKYRQQVGKF